MDVNWNRAHTFFEDNSRHPAASANAPQPGQQDGRADGRMTGKRKLARWGEDSNSRRVYGIVRRIHENRLGEIELTRDRYKQILRHTRRVWDHRERVSL
jgi:hypothetical protein